MANQKSTKRTLLICVVAIAICVTMLIGTTFAWFTDSVSSVGNKIIAGTLDVDLQYKDADGKWVSISENPDPIFGAENSIAANPKNNDTLWEPGKTQVVYLAIENKGSLALKYQVALTVGDPDGVKMYDVMQFAIVPNAQDTVDPWAELDNKVEPVLGTQIVTKDVSLGANSTHYFALVIHMEEEAGNEYQGKSVEFDITVLATQDTVESDAFGPDYDEDAEYNIDVGDTPESLEAAFEHIAPGGTIRLKQGVDYGTVSIENVNLKDVTIQGNADSNVRFNIKSDAVLENVTFTGLDVYNADSSSAYVDGGVINIDAGAKVTNLVVENSVLNGTGGRSSIIGISEPTAQVTLRNCQIDGTKYVVYGSAPIDALTIVGCEIKNISSWAVMLNAGDSVGANLTIDDCDFENCAGGMAKYLGSSQPDGSTTVFTNNTLVSCVGHDGSDAKWFTIPGAVSTITVSGNTLDGAAWEPGTAQGLGK